MKILHIIDGLGIGGAEKLIVEIVPLLVEKGFCVDVLLLNGEKTPFYNELLNTNCTNIYSLGNSFYNPLYILKIIPFLKKYDIIHVHLFPAQYFVVLAKIISFLKVKLIFTEHSTGNRRINKIYFKHLEQWIYKYYEKIICITAEVKKVLIDKLEIGSSKLQVIENGINLDKINYSKRANRLDFGFNSYDKLIIMVAGFREQKDQDTLIKVIALLPQNYKLILVGDGQRRIILEKLTEQIGIKDRVLFLGNRSDVYSLYKMCDIAVLSSHWEGFGLAAIEAMACGIPTIASNVNGLAQVVEGAGILFQKGCVESLLSKIISLENSIFYDEIIKRGISKSKEYDINLMISKIENLYNFLYSKS